MSSAKACGLSGVGMGRARAAIPALSRAQTQDDPSTPYVERIATFRKDPPPAELGWRLAPHKTIEERERAPAGLDRSSLPLLAPS